MKSIILIASLLASPTLTFAFTPVYSRTPLNRREAPDIEDTTIIDCIEGFSTCGPLTSAGHGTIAICSEGYYRTSTTCSNGTTTSCRFVDGLPTCVAGIGEDGLYMDANSVAFDGLYTVSNAVEVERRSIEEREVEVVRRAGMEVGEVMLEVRQAKPTTRKPKRTPVGVSLGTMIARSVSSNTIYGQQGLSWCQYDIILKITSTFETGSQELGFGYCGNWNDGQGISAGFIQFTTSSGSVLLVVQSYLRRTSRSNPPIAAFVTALQRAAQVGNRGAVSGQGHMDGLWNFCESWKEANQNDKAAFQGAQLQIQAENYLAPNKPTVDSLGIKSALGVGILMDTGIQLGLGAVVAIGKNAGWAPSQGASEADFVGRYLDARAEYLNRMGGAYARTLYRIDCYRHVLRSGNLNFSGNKVTALDNSGNQVQVACDA